MSSMPDLLALIHQLPIGIAQFRTDGAVDMMNPAASALLGAAPDGPGLVNIYHAFRRQCPHLGAKVAAFTPQEGTILEQHRIDGRVGRHAVVLSLTVMRMRPDVHMAVLKDITKLTNMLSYAFAAADMLIELRTDATIDWAGGAFQSLLDMRPHDAVGAHLSTLISPRDRDRLAQALMVLEARGRLPPLSLRLNNAAESRCVLAALRVDGQQSRTMVTIGAPPTAQITVESGVKPNAAFTQEAESWIRRGLGGTLELLDVAGWDRRAAGLDEAEADALRESLGALAESTGEDVVLGDFGGGRFGVLGGNDAEIARCADGLEALVMRFLGGGANDVARTRVDLAQADLAPAQSVRVLRLLLSKFATGGAKGAAATGVAGGLGGIIVHAKGQQRSIAAAIAHGRFTMVYQPIVNLLDRTLHHYEALLRPALDLMRDAANPEEFVTMAETVGLARELDLAVLQRVATQMRQGRGDIAVNVSGLSIANPGFTDQLLRVAEGIPRGRLLVELTETAEIEDLDAAARQIDRIRAAHIRVCLDDFGAGSASFRYLRALHVDFVKIDGTYVRAASQSEQGRSFIRAMRDLATNSGAAAIAERIETEEDAALMRELGVTFGQGWLFGRPGPLAPDTAKPTRWRY